MKFGTFYLLPQNNQQKNNTFSCIEQLVFTLTKKQWYAGKTILITCEDKFQAQKIDELLWKYDNNTFLPHDLFTKNTHHTPIIICWTQYHYNAIPKNILINLMKKNMSFFFYFKEIIDFVPFSENLKKLARERYQAYKKIGFQLHIETYPFIS